MKRVLFFLALFIGLMAPAAAQTQEAIWFTEHSPEPGHSMLYVSMTPNIWGMIIVQFHDYTTGRRYNEIFAVRPNVALWMIAYEHPVAAVYGVENGCTQWDALLIPCRDTYEAPPRLFDVPAYDGVPSMGDN